MTLALNDLKALSAIYQLLGRLWLREVDKDLLVELAASPFRELFTVAGGFIPDTVSESLLEDLAVEYCRLFVGPTNHVVPIQSVWQQGRLQSDAADSMKKYASLIKDNLGTEMFDHLGVQFVVMSALIDCYSIDREDDRSAQVVARYFTQHLCWASPLFDAAKCRARSRFYQSLIEMANEFLDSERAFWCGVVVQEQ